MKIYGSLNTRALRCIWAAEEAGADYEVVPIDLAKGEGKSPEFLAVNPLGKVPALVDGDLVLFESGAICNYLGERFPEARLTPPSGTRERALYDQWMFFAIAELEQPLWLIARNRFVNPPDKRVPEIIEVARWEWQKPARRLVEALRDREFILGSHFTMADILLAQTLKWAQVAKASFPDASLEDYMQRMMMRPACLQVLQRA